MREIKFRGWHKVRKSMIYGFENTYDEIHFDDLLISSFGDVIQNLDLELMQYTGLKDKNGVEIYEGDILSEPCCYEKRIDYYEVKFGKTDDNRFGYYLQSFDQRVFKTDFEKMEVAGNVYENPDLIK